MSISQSVRTTRLLLVEGKYILGGGGVLKSVIEIQFWLKSNKNK
jgi:hypothetical protein